MSIYDELKPVAAQILKEFKQGDIKLVSISSTGTPDAPTNTEKLIDLDATCSGVSFKYVKNGMAVMGDLTVTAAVVDGESPSVNDFILVDGVRHKIVQDISPPAAGTRVVWKFIVRRGG